MRPIPMTPIAGVAIMAAAMLVAPLMDVFAKLLTEQVSPGMTGLLRFVAQTVFLFPVVLITGQWGWPHRLHVLAGVFLAIAILFLAMALRVMPVANTIAIFFVEPLILTLLSAYILGEGLGWRRLSAVTVGLIGAMIVIRPNVAEFGWAAVFPVVTAFAFAGYLLIVRHMSQKGGRVALQFWTGVFAMLILAAVVGMGTAADVALVRFGMPDGAGMIYVAAIGIVACISHQMLSAAFARAEAGALAPLQYLEIISATLIGWAIWRDFPDTLTWVGTAVIVSAGVYVFQRERQLARRGVAT